MNIKQRDFVLEIGSGDNPHSRSDVLCDRYITSNQQRAGGFGIRIDRQFVVADGMHLPFPDKTFDYVITSHIFEHMDDPVGFAGEIMRVGRAGYIEVPSALAERVFGWDFHHWYCRLQDGTLTFTRKHEGEQFRGFFHRFIAGNIWFRRFFEEHDDAWYTKLEWRTKIPIHVRKKPMSRVEVDSLDSSAWTLLEEAKPESIKDMAFALRFLLRRIVRKARKTTRLLAWRAATRVNMNLYVCPYCHGPLRGSMQTLSCNACARNFRIDGVIPVLL